MAFLERAVSKRFLGYPIFEMFFVLLVLMGILAALFGQVKIWLGW